MRASHDATCPYLNDYRWQFKRDHRDQEWLPANKTLAVWCDDKLNRVVENSFEDF